MGMFYPFADDKEVKLYGVEAAGSGIKSGKHAATIVAGSEGILHGSHSYILQDFVGQIKITHSISAGLDYSGVGPEHANFYDIKRAEYHPITDDEAVDAFIKLSQTEGIIPALESSHALAYALKIAKKMKKDDVIVVCLSGRGDKDVDVVIDYLNKKGVKIK
jgi:tryptophan synthase beta chain